MRTNELCFGIVHCINPSGKVTKGITPQYYDGFGIEHLTQCDPDGCKFYVQYPGSRCKVIGWMDPCFIPQLKEATRQKRQLARKSDPIKRIHTNGTMHNNPFSCLLQLAA